MFHDDAIAIMGLIGSSSHPKRLFKIDYDIRTWGRTREEKGTLTGY